MNNLICTDCYSFPLTINGAPHAFTACEVCYDSNVDITYLTDGLCIIKCHCGEVDRCCSLSDVRCESNDKIIALIYNSCERAVCFVTTNGLIALYKVDDNQTKCVGAVSAGLICAAGSPDEELLAVVSCQSRLLLMNTQFDVVAELDLLADHTPELTPISVGWGSKRTQFHGSEGKAAAAGDNVQTSTTAVAMRDDSACRLSWRGDGTMLAVTVVRRDTDVRQFMVVSRGGRLLSRAEPTAGAGQCFSWQPLGRLIAGSRHEAGSNRLQLVFYEKNGLRHGQFLLPQSADMARVMEVVWSVDSAVMAVWLNVSMAAHHDAAAITATDATDTDNTEHSVVQLWTMINYHWYLKQQLTFSTDRAVTAVSWHTDRELNLNICSADGCLYSYKYQLAVCAGLNTEIVALSSLSLPSSLDYNAGMKSAVNGHCIPRITATAAVPVDVSVDSCSGGAGGGWVAVIDGRRVLLTALAVAAVPPPMCSVAVHLPAACLAVTLFDTGGDGGCGASLLVFAVDLYVYAFSLGGDCSITDSCPNVDLPGVRVEVNDDAVNGIVDDGGFRQTVPSVCYAGRWCLPDVLTRRPDVSDTRLEWAWTAIAHRRLVYCRRPAERMLAIGIGGGGGICNAAQCAVELVVLDLPAQCSHGSIRHVVPLDSAVHMLAAVPTSVMRQAAETTTEATAAFSLQRQRASSDATEAACCGVLVQLAATGRFRLLNVTTAMFCDIADVQATSPHVRWPHRVHVPALAQQMIVLPSGRTSDSGGGAVLVTLCRQRRVWLNERQIASGCSSLAVNERFLLVTTLEHQLFVVPLTHLTDTHFSWPARCTRNLERGARLVAAPGGGTHVVLQMPRGNLEVIHPRPLVLSLTARLMDRGDYLGAYETMRRHRVDLNLLVDHNPAVFLRRCDDICATLSPRGDWLCVFLSDLRDEDVRQSHYAEYYSQTDYLTYASSRAHFIGDSQTSAAASTVMSADKVNTVCRRVRQSLLREHNLATTTVSLALPAITSWVCQRPPDVEAALQFVGSLSDNVDNDDKCCEGERSDGVDTDRNEIDEVDAGGSGDLTEVGEAALNYLLCLVKADELYDVALSTYRLSLVMTVAERSHKDPKEYVPFLNALRRLPSHYRRYRIDRHLGRHERALRHLVAAGDNHQQEALQYMDAHKIYRLALTLYPSGSAAYKAVCAAYADHLASSGDGKGSTVGALWQAGVYYCRAGAQTTAVDVFRRAGAWRDCLHTATVAGMRGDEFGALCSELVMSLCDAGRPLDVAALCERYLKPRPQEHVRYLLLVSQWTRALAVCRDTGRSQLVETMVRPAVERAVTRMTDSWQRISHEFDSHVNRLQFLRESTISGSAAQHGVAEDNELYSDTSSVSAVSASSSRSFKSSKSRRKQERKKYSLREGSESEDLALIVSCHALASECYGHVDEVADLLRALVLMCLEPGADSLQRHYQDLLGRVEVWCRLVWPPPPATLDRAAPHRDQQDHRVHCHLAIIARIIMLDTEHRQPPVFNKCKQWKLALAG